MISTDSTLHKTKTLLAVDLAANRRPDQTPEQLDETYGAHSPRSFYIPRTSTRLTKNILDIGTSHATVSPAQSVFNAFIKRVQKIAYEKFAGEPQQGIQPEIVRELILTAERYSLALGEYDEYRKFIALVVVLLKSNYDDVTVGSARALVHSLEQYAKHHDRVAFIKSCQASGLSPIRL